MSKSARIKQELGLYARRVSSAIFLSKRSRNEAIRNCGPPSKVEGVIFRVSYRQKLVSATFEGETRTAKFVDGQGSVVLPKAGV